MTDSSHVDPALAGARSRRHRDGQTNRLAGHASIEAARAGDADRIVQAIGDVTGAAGETGAAASQVEPSAAAFAQNAERLRRSVADFNRDVRGA